MPKKILTKRELEIKEWLDRTSELAKIPTAYSRGSAERGLKKMRSIESIGGTPEWDDYGEESDADSTYEGRGRRYFQGIWQHDSEVVREAMEKEERDKSKT